MNLYLNELAPWERKHEYYNNIQLGKDLRSQTELISKQTKVLAATQIAATSRIIASPPRIEEIIQKGFSDFTCKMTDIVDGISGLKAAFEWGISEVVWQIEQNRVVLKDILQILMEPLDTQAKELKRRAVDAYSNGWYDDALKDFILSEEKNRYDFSVHISIGMITLFYKIDKTKALENFEKAIKYARPKSKFHASYALLYKALILLDLNQLELSEKATQEAIDLSPDFIEAYYQNAQYNAQLGNIDKSLSNLEKVLLNQKNYFIKVDTDCLFDPIRDHVNNLIKKLTTQNYNFCTTKLSLIENRINEINEIISINNKMKYLKFEQSLFYNNISKINSLILLNSYFDSLKTIDEIKVLEKEVEAYFSHFKNFVNKLILDYDNQISEDNLTKTQEEKKKNKAFQGYMGSIGSLLIIGSLILGIILGFKGCFADIRRPYDHYSLTTNFLGPIFTLLKMIFFGCLGAGLFYLVFMVMPEKQPVYNSKNESDNSIEFRSRITKLKALINKLEKIKNI